MSWYEISVEPDEDSWLVTSPAFDELATFGATKDEASANGLAAIEEAIAGRIADGEEIPAPLEEIGRKGHFVHLSAMIFLKSALYMTLREQHKTRADLMRALGWHREQVDRLFRLDHDSRLDALEQAFAALGVPLRFDLPFPVAA